MPRLKRLEIQGFKSFADPLTFVFPTSTTAIVGPNGSGKSNLADAVRWVLGEQRMTTIRGKSGEDMIFAGSRKRSRSGMARVAITFDNSDGWLAVDYVEVTVERRTYRDGKTDYLLNGSRVRLTDLRDLLDRAGLGRDAYLIVQQGLVDQVLSLRPQERLALFEQAAGIAPYRGRRVTAIERLDETRRNLQRVYDIVGEIEPRLRRLKRQASRAEQHVELTRALSDTLRTWYGYRWGRAVAALEQARQHAAYHEDRALRFLEESEASSAAVAEHRRQMHQVRAELAALHRQSGEQHSEAGRLQQELAVARERFGQLQQRLDEQLAYLQPLQAAMKTESTDLERLRADLQEAKADMETRRLRLQEAEADEKQIEDRRHALLSERSRLQSEALAARHLLADRQGRLEQTIRRLGQLQQQMSELRDQAEALTERRQAQQAAVEAARRHLEAATEQARLASEAVARLQAELDRGQAGLVNLRPELLRTQSQMEEAQTRLLALERITAEGEGLYGGVRAVMQALHAGELSGLCGTVASLIQVPPELDRAVEIALGSQLQDIVTEDWGAADRAIRWLKQRRAGRATFLPLNELRPPASLELPRDAGAVGLASELVSYEARYRPVADLLLGRTAVAQTLDSARRMYEKLHGSYRIVTLEGELIRSGGSVTGGDDRRNQQGSLLSRERQRRELPETVAQLRQQLDALVDTQRDHEQRVEASRVQLGLAVVEQRRCRQLEQEAERSLEIEVRALEKIVLEATWLDQRAGDLEREVPQLESARASLDATYNATTEVLTRTESGMRSIEQALTELDDPETFGVLLGLRTDFALLEQRVGNRSVALDARERAMLRMRDQVATAEQRTTELSRQLFELHEQLTALQAEYNVVRSASDVLAAQIQPLEADLALREAALEQLERKERDDRQTLRDADQRLSQSEVEANRREDQLQALRREVEETLGIVVDSLPPSVSAQQPLPLDAIVSPLPVVSDLPEGLERQINDLRAQIRGLEPVNLAAKEEYDELTERHAFLREQMQDLETASAQLRGVIDELDQMMDTMFSTTFGAVAAEFSRLFEVLFSGGSGRLELTEIDADSSGVEIIARPPGKRTSGLGMLSGGERTLTAIALLFAVMRVSPTPFCILDEVDAMLDEANVERFRRVLLELTRETQFILITHNRGTVQVADAIYGVSMGEEGVSKVLSVSLADLPVMEQT